MLVTHFPGMLGAIAGLGLIVLAGVTSYRQRAPAPAPRDLVDGPPVHLPGGGHRLLAPARHRRAVPRPPAGARLLDRPLAAHRRRRASYRVGLPLRAQPRPPAQGDPRRAGSARRRVGRRARPSSRPAAGHRRAVPELPLPHARHVVARTPLLALGAARRQRDEDHGEGQRRAQLGARRAPSGHGGGDRRPLRRLHPPRPPVRPGAAGRRGRRRDAGAGAARRPAAARRRGRDRARLERPRAHLARRDQAARGRARRAALRSRGLAHAAAARRRQPAPSRARHRRAATSTSAARAGS